MKLEKALLNAYPRGTDMKTIGRENMIKKMYMIMINTAALNGSSFTHNMSPAKAEIIC